MTIEEQLVQANSRITALEGDLSAANDLLGESQTQVTALTSRAEAADASVARLTGELSTATTNLSAVTGERDTARADLATANRRLASPDTQVAYHCATAHVDPMMIRPGAKAGAAATGEELYAKMSTLPEREKLGFYQENQKAIDAYLRQRGN